MQLQHGKNITKQEKNIFIDSTSKHITVHMTLLSKPTS